MKGVNEVIEFFNTFPKSEFDAQSVIDALSGTVGENTVRNVLKELAETKYLEWRWVPNKTVAKRVYKLSTTVTASIALVA